MTTKRILDYHATKIVNNVASWFDVNTSKNKFSDVEITIGNRSFYCHKVILQLNSEEMVKRLLESGTGAVSLQMINPDQFFEILRFMYTGEVEMSTDTIELLLLAAGILRMGDLIAVCCQFLDDSLDVENVWLYWKLAKKYGHSKLVVKCQELVREDFRKPILVCSLPNASEEMMIKIFSDNNLKVKSELEVCVILLKWLQLRTEAGQKIDPAKLLQLLRLIRWSGISIQYVYSILLHNEALTANTPCSNFLRSIETYLLSGVQVEGLQTFHRPSTGLQNCLMTIGLSDGNKTSSEVSCINLQDLNKINPLTAIPTKMSGGSVACLLHNNVYVTGAGGIPYRETWTWSLVVGWVKCADMLTDRRFHCAVLVDSMLYLLGGRVKSDEPPHHSIECYNIKTNQWSSAGDLVHAVSHAACVIYKNCIYVFGGGDENMQSVAHVQVYNPAQESCTLMNTPMPRALSGMRAVLWKTSVILLSRLTCFIYNFETQIWQEREPFKTNIDYFAIGFENSTVFIFGGGTVNANERTWTCTDEIKSISVLDIIDDKPARWTMHARLPKPGTTQAYINILLPTFI